MSTINAQLKMISMSKPLKCFSLGSSLLVLWKFDQGWRQTAIGWIRIGPYVPRS